MNINFTIWSGGLGFSACATVFIEKLKENTMANTVMTENILSALMKVPSLNIYI